MRNWRGVGERPAKANWETDVRHDGSVAWESDNLGQVFGGHGFGTSPITNGNLVLIANDTEKKSSLLALDRMTGKVVWETPVSGLSLASGCGSRTRCQSA